MNPTLKRYLVSSATTFTTVFLISVGAQLSLAHITPETLGWGIVISIAASAYRAAVKAVIEALAGVTGDVTEAK